MIVRFLQYHRKLYRRFASAKTLAPNQEQLVLIMRLIAGQNPAAIPAVGTIYGKLG